jgi:hypothetical protein
LQEFALKVPLRPSLKKIWFVVNRPFRLCTKLQKGDDSNPINKIKAQIKINEDNWEKGVAHLERYNVQERLWLYTMISTMGHMIDHNSVVVP